jgi:FlaA1/EpsC-like NDP-sugar epimerase
LARRMVELSGRRVRDAEEPDGDIEIRITGLRPGEKLYEELLIGDDPAPTAHPRIMKAREGAVPWSELQPDLALVEDAIRDNDVVTLRRMLLKLVSGYQPTEGIVDWLSAAESGEAGSEPAKLH